MRFCFLFSIILLCTIAKGQDTFFVSVDTAFERQWKTCELTGIINIDSTLSKELIFPKVRQWFSEVFVSAKNVLDNSDLEQGVFYGHGTIPMKNANDGWVEFNIEIRCKDGRVKYKLFNLMQRQAKILILFGDPGTVVWTCDYGSICQEKIPKGMGMGYTGRGNLEWLRLRDYSKRKFFILIRSLKESMTIDSFKSKDDS